MDAHTKQKVRAYMESGGVISQLNGMEVAQTTCAKDYCGFLRRKDGLPIQSKWEIAPSGKRYKIYWLDKTSMIV